MKFDNLYPKDSTEKIPSSRARTAEILKTAEKPKTSDRLKTAEKPKTAEIISSKTEYTNSESLSRGIPNLHPLPKITSNIMNLIDR